MQPPVVLKGPWIEAPETAALMRMFADAGHTARFVGGVVRNALLGEPVHDLDIATDARPQRVIELAEKAGFKAIGTGLDHGTVTVVVGSHIYEITTLRIDVDTHGRHATVAFTDDWHEDAARRDFTMNALYADADGRLFDPLGGYPDLVAGRVRFIGHAEDRIREDYLRILRFFRFSGQYGGNAVDAVGLAACLRLRVGLSRLSAERVRSEFLRLLLTPRALSVLRVMYAHGMLQALLPAVPQLTRLARWIELETAIGLPAGAVNRLGALAVIVDEDVARLRRRLRLSNDEAWRLGNWTVRTELTAETGPQQARRLCYHLGGRYQAVVAVHWLMSGDALKHAGWRQLYDLPTRWQPPLFPLKGRDLMKRGHRPGPDLGRALKALETIWVDSDFSLTRNELLAKI